MEAPAGYGALLTCIPTVDDVLKEHATALRDDFFAYRNHVYRIVNLCVAFAGRSELETIAVAAVFHDLGIWTNGTLDYIAPSIALARDYLVARAREDRAAEIEGIHRRLVTLTLDRVRRHPLAPCQWSECDGDTQSKTAIERDLHGGSAAPRRRRGHDVRHVFLMTGAGAYTAWLNGRVVLD